MPIFAALNVGLFRLFGGRMRIQGRPLLLLTTVGARSGKRRQSTLAWFDDEPPRPDTWLIVASAGGALTHPAWYVNLARRPADVSIDVAGASVAVEPRSLEGAERDRAWKRIVALAPGYGKYEQQTDREIPVVRLTPRG
jgi:deazaflavin-dependent oxidoreductase (nitroreductase family)